MDMKRSCLLIAILILIATCFVSNTNRSLSAAKMALKNFFLALNSEDYEKAVDLYGGSYEIIQGMNPGLDPQDHISLWQHACRMNGFQCLRVKRIVKTVAINEFEYRFTVEFRNPDGSLFIQGPCCGEDETNATGISQFVISVRKMDDEFKVMDLPSYVP
jgi:hypothetical protein